MHKCQHCSQTFTHRYVLSLNFHCRIVHHNSSDDLRSHSVQCNSAPWDQSMMEAMMHYTPEGGIQHNIEFAGGLGIVSAPIVGNPSTNTHQQSLMTLLTSIYFHNLMVTNTTRNQHKDCNTSSLPRSRKAARHHRHRQI